MKLIMALNKIKTRLLYEIIVLRCWKLVKLKIPKVNIWIIQIEEQRNYMLVFVAIFELKLKIVHKRIDENYQT